MSKIPSFGRTTTISNCSLVALLLFLFIASPLGIRQAHAEGFALYEWSARGIALSGALTARTPDASAVAYNPALITKLKGTHIMGGLSTVTPRGTVRFTEKSGVKGSAKPDTSTWYVPHFYMTTELSDRWTIGVGQFSRFGLGFSYNNNWPGRFAIYDVSLQTASINPVIAWKATDDLSIAVGVEAQYLRLDMNKRGLARIPSTPYSFEVDSDISGATNIGFGFNVAAHYQITDQWAIGAQYRSAIKQRAEGENEFRLMDRRNVPAAIPDATLMNGFKDSDVRGTVIMPESVNVGISYEPNEQWSFEANAIWTRWSSFRTLRIHFSEPQKSARADSEVSESKKHWSDAWRLAFGAEYKPLNWLALRVGFAWDQSPMTEHYSDYLVPSDDRFSVSVGAGFKYDNWTLDIAYSMVDIQDRRWRDNDETGTLKSRTKNAETHVASVSFGYSF